MVAACSAGGGTESAPEDGPRPIDPDEAALLADTLFQNSEAGGAEFVAVSDAGGERIELVGVVDWAGVQGRADVTADGTYAQVSEVVWTDSIVLERRPALDETLESAGFVGVEYLARVADPTTNAIDAVIAVVAAAASPQRDNAVLLQQSGATWLRDDDIEGTPVIVIRYDALATFWITADTGELRRLESARDGDGRRVTVDFGARRPVEVALPAEEVVTTLDDLKDRIPGL